ncbi:DUF3307 domain-containing protein [Aquimarina sp. U1-2]|uniref:DUF3307 domain-containing protein n=1 Tax=Aquimarina sp. U1-2 TaxID=2823141 RepID=UPI001AECA476|nr:DUF3307 domain-containing protein [Aquimarina sp. U1-2]MBP2832629.1 DUF3307 domain-containing protein [Aquimarina sp. U1-2]
MTALFLKILVAHCVGDFLLQPASWVQQKQEKKITSKFLYLHTLIHFAILVFLLQASYWIGILFITVSHFLIDVIKLYMINKKNERMLFVIDQIAHLVVLVAVWHYYEPIRFSYPFVFNNDLLLLILSLVFATSISSVCVKYLLRPWDKEIDFENKSLTGAGKYIGIIERLFVFCFVLLNTWSAIGFLITAKSVFRFGDLNDGKNRKLTEYVLIGTLLSFGFAILSGLLYQELLKYMNELV